jgi:ABC-type branched-subunit amino acid transport system ATPase component
VNATADTPVTEPGQHGSLPRHGDILLEVSGVTVRFGGVVANREVSITCREQAITAVIGPNGAGKSTLFDVISGARRPAAGRLFFAGQEITKAPVTARARLGIGRTFQNLSVAREMSVLDNVAIGAARFREYGAIAALLGLPRVRRSDAAIEGLARRALSVVGLEAIAAWPAGSLPYGHLRRLEMARALMLAPRILLLDEPAAGMDQAETEQLAKAMSAMRDRFGITLLFVEHDLDLVRTIAEDVFVLDFGTVLASGRLEDVMTNPEVIAAYVGTTTAETA